MATPFNLVSVDAQTRLTEFSTAFDAGLAAPPPEVMWARDLGLYVTSRAIKTTFPLPVSAAGYVERKGEDRMRSLFEKSVSMTPKEWTDGVQEKAHIIEAPDFIGWLSEPQRMAAEALRHPNTLVAAVLAANAALEFDGLPLFDNSHPVNLFDTSRGTFDNDHAVSAFDIDALAAAKTRFRKKKAPNGKPLGLRLRAILAPSALEEQLRDLLERDLYLQAVQEMGANVGGVPLQNRHRGTVNLVIGDELPDDDAIYLIDDAPTAPKPWIVQDGGAPEEIRFDKDSDFYKTTGLIGIKHVLLAAAVGALPHAIERVTIG